MRTKIDIVVNSVRSIVHLIHILLRPYIYPLTLLSSGEAFFLLLSLLLKRSVSTTGHNSFRERSPSASKRREREDSLRRQRERDRDATGRALPSTSNEFTGGTAGARSTLGGSAGPLTASSKQDPRRTTHRDRTDANLRADSLSSEASGDQQRGAAGGRAPTKHHVGGPAPQSALSSSGGRVGAHAQARHHRKPKLSRQPRSYSSSEEEMPSTSECPSCDDREVPADSYSERGTVSLDSLTFNNTHSDVFRDKMSSLDIWEDSAVTVVMGIRHCYKRTKKTAMLCIKPVSAVLHCLRCCAIPQSYFS